MYARDLVLTICPSATAFALTYSCITSGSIDCICLGALMHDCRQAVSTGLYLANGLRRCHTHRALLSGADQPCVSPFACPCSSATHSDTSSTCRSGPSVTASTCPTVSESPFRATGCGPDSGEFHPVRLTSQACLPKSSLAHIVLQCQQQHCAAFESAGPCVMHNRVWLVCQDCPYDQ
jgi:hypothetical protein